MKLDRDLEKTLRKLGADVDHKCFGILAKVTVGGLVCRGCGAQFDQVPLPNGGFSYFHPKDDE